jgi:hypothetical protein
LGITINLPLPTYDHNPGSLRYIGRADLLFKPYEQFDRVDPDERLDLCPAIQDDGYSGYCIVNFAVDEGKRKGRSRRSEYWTGRPDTSSYGRNLVRLLL